MKKKSLLVKIITRLLVLFIVILAATNVSAASGYRVNPGNTVKIDEWGECRNVTNSSGYPAAFVPTKTSTEWAEFRIHYPPHISLSNCCNANTCASLGKECGQGYNDNCGGELNCGGCPSPQFCEDGVCCSVPAPITASCSSVPNGGKRIFVTSASYTSSQIASETDADSKCAAAANAAGLSGTYKAFVWVGNRSPVNVIADTSYWNAQRSGSNCVWYLVGENNYDFWHKSDCEGSGTCSGETSLAAVLKNPIKYDENGSATSDQVWTGFTYAKTLISPTTASYTANCGSCTWGGWYRSNGCMIRDCSNGCKQALVWYGKSDCKSTRYSFIEYSITANDAASQCNSNPARRIYCAQQ